MRKSFLVVLCLVISPNVFASSSLAGYGVNMQPMLQLAPNACYAAKDGISSRFGMIGDGLDYQTTCNYLQTTKDDTKYGSAVTAYINSLSNNAVNTHQYDTVWILGNDINVAFNGYGQDALNAFGQEIYNTQNSSFDIKCGGYALDEYVSGTFITAALVINFSNSTDSEDYRVKTLADPQGLRDRAARLQNLANQYKYSGTVTIQAMQLGGTAAALTTTGMARNAQGYYGLTCALSDMQKCIDATNGYYVYMTQDYPKQFNTSTEQGLVPLLANVRTIPKRYLGL